MRIPFDSLCLNAVVAELQPLVGARLEHVKQTDEHSLVVGFWSGNQDWLFMSAHPNYPRAYLVSRRMEGLKPAPTFTLELRKRLDESTLVFARQRGIDRVLELGFDGPNGPHVLVAELMGKHSNIMLVQNSGEVVAAAKWVGATKSVRPTLPNKPYVPPPFEPKPSLIEATPGDDLRQFEGASPFLIKLIESGQTLSAVQSAIKTRSFHPVYCHGHGAYPLSVASLGLDEVPRRSISQALEQHFEALVDADRFAQTKTSLKSQLNRVLLAREVALNDVQQAIETARDARSIQIKGELVLAYQGQIESGSTELEAWDYEGNPVKIPLRADLTPSENADRYFNKAKKAKARASEVESQYDRLELDHKALIALLSKVESAESLVEIEDLRKEADSHKWLQRSGEAKAKEDRPFEGFAVRELLSPSGWRVLYGDNATSNDYLTTKVAKPADLWFHVRGAPSAHVIVCTNNQPLKVQRPDLEFAALVAVRHSPSKHSGYVSVDYTQKRYVRKPRGAAPGLAVYTNEKTIHVSDS